MFGLKVVWDGDQVLFSKWSFQDREFDSPCSKWYIILYYIILYYIILFITDVSQKYATGSK